MQREPKTRKVQAAQLRDYNIVSNRYHQDHEGKLARDVKLCNLELTHKYNQRNRFNPVMQKYTDTEIEERHRICDDAREVEVMMRGEACLPPTLAGRVTAHYDMITHRADDEGTLNLKLQDMLENQRKSRYNARHVDEHRQRMQDVVAEDASTNQRHEFVAHDRWEEATGRGYNIVNNRAYGKGHKFEKLHEPFTVPSLTTWEKVEKDRSGLTPPTSARGSRAAADATAQQGSRSARAANAGRGGTPRASGEVITPRAMRPTPRTLSDAGSATLSACGSGRPPLAGGSMPARQTGPPPPPPPIPGSPVGSVYSRRM